MADERTYYVICDDNCKFISMTKEQILTAIDQAISTGSITDVNTGFVTKIKEQNKNVALQFWVGTQAEYNALDPKPQNTFCIITDATDEEDIENAINELRKSLTLANNVANGNIKMFKYAFPYCELNTGDNLSISLNSGHNYNVAYCTEDGLKVGYTSVQYFGATPIITYEGGEQFLNIEITGTKLFIEAAGVGQKTTIVVLQNDAVINFAITPEVGVG